MEMSSSSSSTIVEGQDSGNRFHTPTHTQGAYFILYNLPFHSQDDSAGARPYLPYRIENLAATHISPLEQILLSNLNAAGFVRAIYVNFGPRGCYELNPKAKPVTQPELFQAQLRLLFQSGKISNHDNNEFIWRIAESDLSSLMVQIPNSRVIGCLHGPGSEEIANFRDYIRTAPDEQVYVFVVGKIDNQERNNQEIQTYIDDYIRVPGYDLETSHCLGHIISEMEEKWGI